MKSNSGLGRTECTFTGTTRKTPPAARAPLVPPNARKLIHRWRDGRLLPDVREL